MSADNGRVKISRFCSDSEKQKQVLQETVIFCVLEINWLAAWDTPFSSSKTTCNISATSCWVLKSKGTPLKLDSLRFKAHKKLDGSKLFGVNILILFLLLLPLHLLLVVACQINLQILLISRFFFIFKLQVIIKCFKK